MQKILSLLIICLFFFSCQSNSEDSNETEKREEFVKMALRSNDVIDAKWESQQVLVVTVEQGSQDEKLKLQEKDENGNDVYVDSALFTAVAIANLGKMVTKNTVCAKVVYPDGQELANECSE